MIACDRQAISSIAVVPLENRSTISCHGWLPWIIRFNVFENETLLLLHENISALAIAWQKVCPAGVPFDSSTFTFDSRLQHSNMFHFDTDEIVNQLKNQFENAHNTRAIRSSHQLQSCKAVYQIK